MNPIHECPACHSPTRRKTCCNSCLLHFALKPTCMCQLCVVVSQETTPPESVMNAAIQEAVNV